jgi:inorganic pyrophosphatase
MARTLDRLDTFDDDGNLNVVIEATAGTRSKHKYDPALGLFSLHHVVPAGTSFPLDFGFIPGTRGEDGDPLDILLFADEPTPLGVLVPTRVVGVLRGRQSEKGSGKAQVRNDRFLAVAAGSHTYSHWQGLGDIPGKLLEELEAFFVSYNAQRGVRYTPDGRLPAKEALGLVRKSMRKARKAT